MSASVVARRSMASSRLRDHRSDRLPRLRRSHVAKRSDGQAGPIPTVSDDPVNGPLGELIDLWCEQRDLRPLALRLPAYTSNPGLTDDWAPSYCDGRQPFCPPARRRRDAGMVRAALAQSGIEADRVCIGVRESVAMAENTCTRPSLAALNDLGIRAAIDDFGIGYSSPAYLHTLPVRTMKVDRSFVERLGDRRRLHAGSRSDNRDEPRHRTACGGRGSKQRSPPATGRGAGLRSGPGLLLGRTHARPGVRLLVAGGSAAHRCRIQIRCPMSPFS